MHLINTTTLKLKEFVSEEDVNYAILSHRWEEEEILFEDMTNLDSCTKTGLSKLRSFCKLIQETGREWAWVDTCCIDKKSSAELSEAINSMYRWYNRATSCVAYLSDVYVTPEDEEFENVFCESVWFTRCWTLQELLAPPQVQFYNRNWIEIGSKSSMAGLIAKAANIDRGALRPYVNLSDYCVGERMSWASRRHATRVEDQAYSLLGLFGVNMPMLYGEGERAFERLQLEILNVNDDETIFSWENEELQFSDGGLLAPSPSDFVNSWNHKRVDVAKRSAPWSVTSRGITTTLRLHKSTTGTGVCLAMLNAARRRGNEEWYCAIFLRPVRGSSESYTRTTWVWPGNAPGRYDSTSWFTSYASMQENRSLGDLVQVFVRQRANAPLLPPLARFCIVLPPELCKPRESHSTKGLVGSKRVRTPALKLGRESIELAPRAEWSSSPNSLKSGTRQIRLIGGPGPICNVHLDGQWYDLVMIHIGINDQLQLCLLVFDDLLKDHSMYSVSLLSYYSNLSRVTSFDYAKMHETKFRQTLSLGVKGNDYVLEKDQDYTGDWLMIGEPNQQTRWKFLKITRGHDYTDDVAFRIAIFPVAPATVGRNVADFAWRLSVIE